MTREAIISLVLGIAAILFVLLVIYGTIRTRIDGETARYENHLRRMRYKRDEITRDWRRMVTNWEGWGRPCLAFIERVPAKWWTNHMMEYGLRFINARKIMNWRE